MQSNRLLSRYIIADLTLCSNVLAKSRVCQKFDFINNKRKGYDLADAITKSSQHMTFPYLCR